MPNQLPGALPQAQYQAPPAPARQAMPPLANLAAATHAKPPITARGVAPTAAEVRYRLPGPDALGVPTSLNLPERYTVTASVDWNQLQTRVERLRVLRYEKVRLASGAIQVTLLLPTSDPTKGQPITAQAATEPDALVMLLDFAEAMARKQ
jgi:hypothetical protein